MLAHGELFIGTAWYRKVISHHWCEAVGIRREDSPGYVDAIATNLTGTHPAAFTLAAIEKCSFKIAGYVYCHLPDDSAETFVVGHLKVDTQYQRRGVGSMLLTAGQSHASQRGWRCSKARLAVLAENRPARNCHAQAGFRQVSSSHAKLAKGVNHEVQRLQMAQSLARSRGKRGGRYSGRDPCTGWPEILQMCRFEPKLKRRACGNRGHVGQCFIARAKDGVGLTRFSVCKV